MVLHSTRRRCLLRTAEARLAQVLFNLLVALDGGSELRTQRLGYLVAARDLILLLLPPLVRYLQCAGHLPAKHQHSRSRDKGDAGFATF